MEDVQGELGGTSYLYRGRLHSHDRTGGVCMLYTCLILIVAAAAPGFFSSEMTDGMLERIGDITPTLNRKRIPTAEQMDSTLLFLLSPSSECVTGTCIKIDDGQMVR